MAPPKLSSGIPGDGVSARFSRDARLRKHADFDTVYRNGRRLFSAHMTVFFLPRNAGGARVGFTIPRALGGAVVRNRIRRRMREATRLNLGTVGSGVDVVLHPKKSALMADFAVLCREITRAFEKVRSAVEESSAQ
jgi:ribonuclease P protein component